MPFSSNSARHWNESLPHPERLRHRLPHPPSPLQARPDPPRPLLSPPRPCSVPDLPTPAPFDPTPRVAQELSLPLPGVRAVAKLLAEGASVPFIARYRKEQTVGLDEVQIRAVEEKRAYYTEVHERRTAILAEIEKQGKLTPALRAQIEGCWVKATLEDLYLPYKPKRRTRAMIAKGAGPRAARPPHPRPALT